MQNSPGTPPNTSSPPKNNPKKRKRSGFSLLNNPNAKRRLIPSNSSSSQQPNISRWESLPEHTIEDLKKQALAVQGNYSNYAIDSISNSSSKKLSLYVKSFRTLKTQLECTLDALKQQKKVIGQSIDNLEFPDDFGITEALLNRFVADYRKLVVDYNDYAIKVRDLFWFIEDQVDFLKETTPYLSEWLDDANIEKRLDLLGTLYNYRELLQEAGKIGERLENIKVPEVAPSTQAFELQDSVAEFKP